MTLYALNIEGVTAKKKKIVIELDLDKKLVEIVRDHIEKSNKIYIEKG